MHALLLGLLLSQTPPVASPSPARIERLSFDASKVSRKHALKDVVAGVRWRDANGENVLVLSHHHRDRPYAEGDWSGEQERVSVYDLQAVHLVRAGGRERELRRVWDSSSGCGFDNNTGFLKDALEVSDLDGDGVGEVLFAYLVQCTSDVSHATMKLLLLENGEKYILRGENSIQVAVDTYEDGKLTIDSSFDKGPPQFLEHALSRWEQWMRRRVWGSQ